MAIPAERFKFLDKETNVATADLSTITGSSNINSPELDVQTAKTLPIFNDLATRLKSSDKVLIDTLEKQIDSQGDTLAKNVMKGFKSIASGNMEMKVFDQLFELDSDALKGFFKDAIKAVAVYLCNSREFIKASALGYAVSRDVLSGLLIGFLLTLLDILCKSVLDDDFKSKTSRKDILEALFPPQNDIDDKNAFQTFVSLVRDNAARRSEASTTPPTFDSAQIVADVKVMDEKAIPGYMEPYRRMSVDVSQKNSLLQRIDTELGTVSPGSPEQRRLLIARAEAQKLSPVGNGQRYTKSKYEHLNYNFGKLGKAVAEGKVNKRPYNDNASVAFNEFIDNVKSNPSAFEQRSLNTRSFKDINPDDYYDTAKEADIIAEADKQNTPSSNSHRWLGTPVTTEHAFS